MKERPVRLDALREPFDSYDGVVVPSLEGVDPRRPTEETGPPGERTVRADDPIEASEVLPIPLGSGGYDLGGVSCEMGQVALVDHVRDDVKRLESFLREDVKVPARMDDPIEGLPVRADPKVNDDVLGVDRANLFRNHEPFDGFASIVIPGRSLEPAFEDVSGARPMASEEVVLHSEEPKTSVRLLSKDPVGVRQADDGLLDDVSVGARNDPNDVLAVGGREGCQQTEAVSLREEPRAGVLEEDVPEPRLRDVRELDTHRNQLYTIPRGEGGPLSTPFGAMGKMFASMREAFGRLRETLRNRRGGSDGR